MVFLCCGFQKPEDTTVLGRARMSDDFLYLRRGAELPKMAVANESFSQSVELACQPVQLSITFNSYLSPFIALTSENSNAYNQHHGMRTKVVLDEFLLLFLPNIIYSPPSKKLEA
jgi:hypothetical protein